MNSTFKQDRTFILLQAIVIAVIFCFGFYFRLFYLESYEAGFTSLLAGIITREPFSDFYYICHIVIGKFYGWLHKCLPGVPWYNAIMLLYLFSAINILLYLNYILLKKSGLPLKSILFYQASLFLLIFYDSIMNINLTRICFLLGGAGFLLLLFNWKYDLGRKVTIYAVATCCLVLSFLTRTEPMILMLLFFTGFPLITGFNFSKLIKLYLPMIILVFGTYSWFAYDRATTKEYHKLIEPDIEYELIERQNIVPISAMKTPLDSMLYLSVVAMRLDDTTLYTIPFLRSLIKDSDKPFLIDPQIFKNAVVAFLSENVNYYFPFILFISFITIILALKLPQAWLIRIVAVHLLFWVLMFMVTYKIKMELRVFSPMLLMLYFSIMMTTQESKTPIASLLKNKFSVILVLVLLLFTTSIYYTNTRVYQKIAKSQQLINDEINGMNSFQYVILDINSIDIVNTTIPFNVKHPFEQLFYAPDLGPIPGFDKWLSDFCKCNPTPNNFYEFLKINHPHNTLIISTPEEMRHLSEYLKIVYGTRINFCKLAGEHVIDTVTFNDTKFNYFIICKEG